MTDDKCNELVSILVLMDTLLQLRSLSKREDLVSPVSILVLMDTLLQPSKLVVTF